MGSAGFTVSLEQIRVRNSGQFMDVYLDYDATFSQSAALRPQIKLEFIAMGTKSDPETKKIMSMIHQFLGSKVSQKSKNLLCVTVTETAAEKWVAFTRRMATIARNYSDHDATLIRHLYDLCMLDQKNRIDENFYSLLQDIIKSDMEQYKNQNPEYTANPIKEIRLSLSQLKQNPKWGDNWHEFSEAMIYRQNAPDFNEALDRFIAISELALDRLDMK